MERTTLAGKVALVTGASRGIGRAIALELADRGAHVAVNYAQRADAASETVAAIERQGVNGMAVRADVSRKADVEAMLGQVAEALGPVDILINNAGVQTEAAFVDLTETEWDRVTGVNLKGAFLCAQAAARAMLGRGGRIVTISSICGHVVFRGFAHYSASKAAVEMLTKAMAVELAPHGVTANAVAPGWVGADLSRQERDSQTGLARRVVEHTPIGRLGVPADVAGLVAFLCSDQADWITGQVFTVDGGFEIGRDV